MEYLANVFVEKLLQHKIVKREDKELYVYGFWQGAILIFNGITVILIGFLFKMLWQSLTFMFAYGLLRPVAGGYHARSQRSCYILSIVLITSVLTILKYLTIGWISCLFFLVISTGIIFLLAPVEDQNKPLDEVEHLVYKQRSHKIVMLLFLFTIMFLVLQQNQIAECISMSVTASATMLVLGKIKNSILYS